MKIFVFKPTNEPIGRFVVSSLEVEELERELAIFAQGRTVPRYAYLECGVQTWTVVDEDGLRLEEGRVRPEVDPAAQPAFRPSLMRRYLDRYRRARFVTGAGTVIKVLSFLVAIVVLGGALSSPLGGEVFFPAVLAALSAGAPIFVVGIVVGVLGDIHRTTLDNAVHGSPFLEDDEKARLLEVSYPKPGQADDAKQR